MPCQDGRPPQGALHVERWDGTSWSTDDGQPGIAFSYLDTRGFPMALACSCQACWHGCHGRSLALQCAMVRTCERYRCANGTTFEQLGVVQR